MNETERIFFDSSRDREKAAELNGTTPHAVVSIEKRSKFVSSTRIV